MLASEKVFWKVPMQVTLWSSKQSSNTLPWHQGTIGTMFMFTVLSNKYEISRLGG